MSRYILIILFVLSPTLILAAAKSPCDDDKNAIGVCLDRQFATAEDKNSKISKIPTDKAPKQKDKKFKPGVYINAGAGAGT